MPEPEKLEREPPETEISARLKSEEFSESWKEMRALPPARREEEVEERAMVGGVLSVGGVGAGVSTCVPVMEKF